MGRVALERDQRPDQGQMIAKVSEEITEDLAAAIRRLVSNE